MTKKVSLFMNLRQLRGLTQQELGSGLGVTYQTIGNWERGITVPTLAIPQFKILLRILHITVDELPDDFGPILDRSLFQEMRERVAITRGELAKRLRDAGEKVTEKEIKQWEDNSLKPNLSMHEAALICNLLGITIEQLVACFTTE